jgi:tight adherence protein C
MLRALEHYIDPQFLTMLFAAIAAGATVLTLAMPLLARDTLSTRMKAVAFEREKIRQRERERLAQGSKVSLRQSPKAYMNTVVQNFNLSKWVGQEAARMMLVQAGYRGHAPYVTYLFFRMVMPIAMLLISLFYVFVVIKLDQPTLIKIGIGIGAAYFGMLSPNLYLKNKIQRRQTSIKRGISRRAGPPADLHRIRNVGRGRVSKSQRGSRRSIGRACRRIYVDDRGTVISSGPPPSLR